jgi:methyl-accepting chemotaxis protein
MVDDKRMATGDAGERINVNEEYELRDWAKQFNVSPDQIREAVKTVGDRASDVEMHLKGSRSSSNASREAAATARR